MSSKCIPSTGVRLRRWHDLSGPFMFLILNVPATSAINYILICSLLGFFGFFCKLSANPIFEQIKTKMHFFTLTHVLPYSTHNTDKGGVKPLPDYFFGVCALLESGLLQRDREGR